MDGSTTECQLTAVLYLYSKGSVWLFAPSPVLVRVFPSCAWLRRALFLRETLHFLARPEAQKGAEATASSDLSTSERALLMGTSEHLMTCSFVLVPLEQSSLSPSNVYY